MLGFVPYRGLHGSGAGRRDTAASRGRRKRAGRGAGAALRPGDRAAGAVGGRNAGSAPAGFRFQPGIRGGGATVIVAVVVTVCIKVTRRGVKWAAAISVGLAAPHSGVSHFC